MELQKKLVLEETGKTVDGAVPPAVKGGNDDLPKGGSGKRDSFKCLDKTRPLRESGASKGEEVRKRKLGALVEQEGDLSKKLKSTDVDMLNVVM